MEQVSKGPLGSHAHCRSFYKYHNMGSTHMLVTKWGEKSNVCLCSYSAIKKYIAPSFATMWVGLEYIQLGERIQGHEEKCHNKNRI